MPYFTANNSTVVDGNYLEEYARVYLTEPEIMERYVGDRLWMWGGAAGSESGTPALGQLTIPLADPIDSKSSPVQTLTGGINWVSVSSGQDDEVHTAAIKTDGTLWTWGINDTGQLGDNTVTAKSSPVQTVSSGTNWKKVAAGSKSTAAIKTDGTLWVWGLNNFGQLGDNTRTNRSSPIQTVSAVNNWKEIAAGGGLIAAIKTDGTLWIWGTNVLGQLGDGTRNAKSSPVQTIAGGNNWKQVSVTGALTPDSAGEGGFAAAVKTDGTLWTWGGNRRGQLGDNTVAHRSSPVQTIAGGTNWKQVSIGGNSSVEAILDIALPYAAAIKTDGTLWTWGNNVLGVLGDNTVISRSSPVQTISGGTNWKQVSASGNQNMAAIKTDGTLWTWGYGGFGGLGTSNTTHRSSPVQTIAAGNNWKQVSVGCYLVGATTFAES